MRFQHGVDDSPTRDADLGDRKRGILLQNSKDFSIYGIHETILPTLRSEDYL